MTKATLQPTIRLDERAKWPSQQTRRSVEASKLEVCCDECELEWGWKQESYRTRDYRPSWGYGLTHDPGANGPDRDYFAIEQPRYCAWCGAKHDITTLPTKTLRKKYRVETTERQVTIPEETVTDEGWEEVEND